MIPILDRDFRTGATLDYARYVRFQERLRARRRELLLFCHHPPVLTAGVQAQNASLRTSVIEREHAGIPIVSVGRGGDYTAHEPGQCVIYPHLDLRARDLQISAVFRDWLALTAEALHEIWGIAAASREGAPGLYTRDGAKIASIGLMFKSFFTSFGVAVNIANDLATFAHIHPCGYADLNMTSVTREQGDPALTGRFVTAWSHTFADWLSQSKPEANHEITRK